MSVTSGDPQRLQQFVEQAAPLTGQLFDEAGAVTSACAGFLTNGSSTITGMNLPGLNALGSVLQDMQANQAFVTAVARALVTADGWAGVGVVSIDDTRVAQLITTSGGLQGGGYLSVEPSALLGDPPTSGFVDDPVCTATGNFFHHEVDLPFPARSSVLDLGRCYNSLASDRAGAFGPGWISLLDVALAGAAGRPRVLLPDGAEIAFGVSESGGFVGEARSHLRLRRLGDGGWELADGPASGFVFDEDGLLMSRWTGQGRVVVRRERGAVVALGSEASGRFIDLTWEAGRVVAARSSDGQVASYRYVDGHLVGVERPAGSVSYDIDGGRVASVVDADGVLVVRNVYDEGGRVLAQESPFGRTSHYRYGEAGVTVVTGSGPAGVVGNGDGVRNAFVHDRRGNLTAMVGADGATLRLRYDAEGRLLGWRDRRGSEWSVAWNAAGTRPMSRRGPGGWEESFAWDPEDRLVEHRSLAGVWRFEYGPGQHTPSKVVEPGGATTVIEVDALDLPLAVTDPDGVRVELAWDTDGQLASVTDALHNEARLAYDGSGSLTRLTQPSGTGVAYTCDPAGRVLSAVAPRAGWTWAWSAAGRAVAGTDPVEGAWSASYGDHGAVVEVLGDGGRPTRLRYDAFGNTAEIEGPDGRVYRQAHDGLSQLASVTDPAGATWHYSYDPEGSVVGVVSPTGAATRREIDALGRTVSETDAEGRTWRRVWGPNGRLAEVVDPAGQITAFGYDEAGRVVEVAVDGIVVGSWAYTPAGRLAGRWVIGGPSVTYEWDDAGRLAVVSDAEDRLRIVSDVDGRVVRAVDEAGRTLSVMRDEAGSVVGVVDRKGRERRLELDGAGRLSSASNAAGASHFTWEGSLLTGASDALGATTRYGYDEAGRLATVTDPLGGRTSLAYDAAGRMGAVTDALGRTSTMLRDAAGGLLGVSFPGGGGGVGARRWADSTGATVGYSGLGDSGPSVAVRRDPSGRLIGLPSPGKLRSGHRPSPIDGIGFDGSGRVVAGTAGDVYGHDAAGQVVEWISAAGHSAVYEYDLGGRLVAERQGEAITRYEHDAAGRLVRRVGPRGIVTDFTYDVAGRRIGESASDGSSFSYEWDAGRLVGIMQGSSRTELVYDNLGLPVEIGGVPVDWDLTTGWPVLARIGELSYAWAEEGLFCRRDGGDPVAVSLDWTRSAEGDLDPWGAGAGHGVRLGFRGELAIEGLVFLRARFYDPATRSFLSPDPLPNPPGAPCGANPYHYAWNDPVSLVDPSGMRALTQEEFEHRKHLDEIGHAGQMVDSMARDPWGSLALGLTVALGVGLCFVPIPGAAVVGAGILIGVGTSSAFGVATGQFNPRTVAASGLIGGASAGAGLLAGGVLASSGAPAILTRIGAGALAGGVGNAIGQGVAGHPFSWTSFAESAGVTGLAGGLGPWVGGKLARTLGNREAGPTLFRGTSEDFAGSPGAQHFRMTPTSTDPVVATAFAIHADQFGSGVLHIASPWDLAGVKMSSGYLSYESEVAVGLTPTEFASRASRTVSSGAARTMLQSLGISIPGRLASPEDVNLFLKASPRLTEAEIEVFLRSCGSR